MDFLTQQAGFYYLTEHCSIMECASLSEFSNIQFRQTQTLT